MKGDIGRVIVVLICFPPPPSVTVPVDMQCLTPGCTRPRRMMDDGSGYYDYCGRTCRDKALQTQPLGICHTCS